LSHWLVSSLLRSIAAIPPSDTSHLSTDHSLLAHVRPSPTGQPGREYRSPLHISHYLLLCCSALHEIVHGLKQLERPTRPISAVVGCPDLTEPARITNGLEIPIAAKHTRTSITPPWLTSDLCCVAASLLVPSFVTFTSSSFLPCEFQDSLDLCSNLRNYCSCHDFIDLNHHLPRITDAAPFGKQKSGKKTDPIA
jgi:hypothetical protein